MMTSNVLISECIFQLDLGGQKDNFRCSTIWGWLISFARAVIVHEKVMKLQVFPFQENTLANVSDNMIMKIPSHILALPLKARWPYYISGVLEQSIPHTQIYIVCFHANNVHSIIMGSTINTRQCKMVDKFDWHKLISERNLFE